MALYNKKCISNKDNSLRVVFHVLGVSLKVRYTDLGMNLLEVRVPQLSSLPCSTARRGILTEP